MDLTFKWQSGIFEVGTGTPVNIAAMAMHYGYMGGRVTTIGDTDIVIEHKTLVADPAKMPKGFDPQICVMQNLMEMYAKGT